MSALAAFGVAVLGGALQELVHWYQLRKEVAQGELDSLLRSRAYWVIVVLMVIGGAGGAVVWYMGEPPQAPRTYLLMGAAFPLLLKKAVTAMEAGKGPAMGRAPTTSRDVVRTYFR